MESTAKPLISVSLNIKKHTDCFPYALAQFVYFVMIITFIKLKITRFTYIILSL